MQCSLPPETISWRASHHRPPIPLGSIPNPATHPQGRGGPVRRQLPATLVVEKLGRLQPYRRGHPGQAPSRRGSRSSSNRADTWPQRLIPSREGQIPREGLFLAPECHMTILAPSRPTRNSGREGCSIARRTSRFAKYILLPCFPSITTPHSSYNRCHRGTYRHKPTPNSLPDPTLSTSIERPAFVPR